MGNTPEKARRRNSKRQPLLQSSLASSSQFSSQHPSCLELISEFPALEESILLAYTPLISNSVRNPSPISYKLFGCIFAHIALSLIESRETNSTRYLFARRYAEPDRARSRYRRSAGTHAYRIAYVVGEVGQDINRIRQTKPRRVRSILNFHRIRTVRPNTGARHNHPSGDPTLRNPSRPSRP